MALHCTALQQCPYDVNNCPAALYIGTVLRFLLSPVVYRLLSRRSHGAALRLKQMRKAAAAVYVYSCLIIPFKQARSHQAAGLLGPGSVRSAAVVLGLKRTLAVYGVRHRV